MSDLLTLEEGDLDIRHELEAMLTESRKTLETAFSFHETYPQAPNPTLNLSGVGVVGLPLSARDAEAIKSGCVQAPFGMGERTVVDTTVRDTWEMDAKLVTFMNPQWNKFVSKTVHEICTTLGVNFASSQPRAELYKLLLYETGSHFLPHVDTEKADGMFGTIIFVLPSYFTGGEAHLSFGERSARYDCAHNSRFETSVLAWYTDVTHEIKPITSGYRLALSYNLIHTTQTLRPALIPVDGIAERLRRVLQAWSANTRAPQKLLYLLEHRYSKANLRASALKGSDAQTTALLAALAHTHGVRLGLANVACHLSGAADDPYGEHEQRAAWGYDDLAPSDVEDDELEFAEVTRRVMRVGHFVDLEGTLIDEMLEFDAKRETIPADLARTVEEGDYDDQEYEGYMGNGAGSLERWYRRTVLVLWPVAHDGALLYAGAPGFARALAVFACPPLAISAVAERALAELLVAHPHRDARAAATVCAYALMMHDGELWTRAVAACAPGAGTRVVEAGVWRRAVEMWGWDAVRPSLELVFAHEPGNKTRLEFLWACQGVHAEARVWAAAQFGQVLSSLRAPAVEECDVLLRAAHEHGGISVVRDILLPQLPALASEDFLREFASQLSASDLFDSPEKASTVWALLHAVLSKIMPQVKPVHLDPAAVSRDPNGNVHTDPANDARVALANCYLQTCSAVGCPDLAVGVLDKLGSTSHLSAPGARQWARAVMLPVAKAAVDRLRDSPYSALKDKIAGFTEDTVRLYFDWFIVHNKDMQRKDVEALIDVCLIDGDATRFVTSIAPRLEAVDLNIAQTRTVIDELHAQRARFTFPAGYAGRPFDTVFASLVDRVICASSLQTAPETIAMLDWLYTLGAPAFWQRALARYVDTTNATAAHVKAVLVPLVPLLRQWGLKHSILADLSFAFTGVMKAWVHLVLGPAPRGAAGAAVDSKDLAQWECPCANCRNTRRFLTQGTARTKTLEHVGVAVRKHVENVLVRYASGFATWEAVPSVPQGLKITKKDAVHKASAYTKAAAGGKALLKTISEDDEELRMLLGADYEEVMVALQMKPKKPKVAPRASVGPDAAGPGASMTAKSTSVASESGPSAPVQPPRDPEISTAVESSSALNTARAGERPAKRQRVAHADSEDVMDLT
ncbi:hypothetical protein PsYK624_034560 [Phanerochaete sordida]|uniref:Prolyl 4-hydroxylase alpha subunit Fe(2+) 2OG dioxygenase domain-containing protein n=1 Tax=Phanerochaete sordida TaxID=48140 RepID=A0A9P3LAV8_9APHY|nr:hypothetical protein PsYK624_034560 [Phanerochaete sordida]